MKGLCKPNECNCEYSWSDCDLANLNNKSTTALLTKLGDEVEGLDKYSVHNTGDWVAEPDGWLYLVSEVLALLEKAGER